MGSAYSDGGVLWSTMVNNGNANMQKSASKDYKESMDKLRMLNLYSTGEEHEVGININEVQRSLPTSAGMVKYNGEKINTFNGSQLFYHYLGAIRFLDKENQILKDELETERERNDELEQKLNEQQAQIDELYTLIGQSSGTTNVDTPNDTPNSSSKILHVFPNPTANVINVEVGFGQSAKEAEIHIFDMSSRLISTKSINVQQNMISINLNEHQLPNGQYTCTLFVDGLLVDSKTIVFSK